MDLTGFSKHYGDIIYLDSAATSLTPLDVVRAGSDYYNKYNANPHRGMYAISERASYEWESARATLENYINTESTPNGRMAFTSGATHSLNHIAWNWRRYTQSKSIESVVHIGPSEHHSNIVNWQNQGIRVRAATDWADLISQLKGSRGGLCSIAHLANTTGAEAPLEELWITCEKQGHFLFLDCCQTPAHHYFPSEFCHGLGFSGHKMYGPNGIGGLWLRDPEQYNTKNLFCQPMMAGGGIVESVSISETVLKTFPYNCEAGTGNVPGAVGMAKAVHYLNKHTIPVLQSHCKSLVSECINRLSDICTVYISDKDATSIFPFDVNGVHSSDVATILGAQNICIRSGKLCAEPYVDSISDSGSIGRASFAIYNTIKDVEVFTDAVRTIHRKHS